MAEIAPDPRRWSALLVLCLSLVVIGMDNTILNVALPTLSQRALGHGEPAAVDRGLLRAGVRGPAADDGQRWATASGASWRSTSVWWSSVSSSVLSAFAGSADVLIAYAAVMGVGGALIMPATLSIITATSSRPTSGGARSASGRGWRAGHRARSARGRLAAGALLVGVGVPRQRAGRSRSRCWPAGPSCASPRTRASEPLDPVGARPVDRGPREPGLRDHRSAGARLVDPLIVAAFAVAAVLLVALRLLGAARRPPDAAHAFFRSPRFSAASVRDHAGVLRALRHDLPADPVPAVRAGLHAAGGRRADPADRRAVIVARRCRRRLVAAVRHEARAWPAGLLHRRRRARAALHGDDHDSGYGLVAASLVVLGIGMGLTMAPATESIMGALPWPRPGWGRR